MVMTTQEKNANKAARQVRDRAYNQRKRIYRKQIEQAEQDPEVLALRAKADRINEEVEKYHQAKQDKIDALQEQIDQLEQQIKDIRKLIMTSEPAKASMRSKAYDDWRRAMDAKRRAVDEQFPDLQGPAHYSSAAWEPPADVLEQMEQARRSATVDATAHGKGATKGKTKAEKRSKAKA